MEKQALTVNNKFQKVNKVTEVQSYERFTVLKKETRGARQVQRTGQSG